MMTRIRIVGVCAMGLVMSACSSTATRSEHGLVDAALVAPGADDGFDARTMTIHRGDASGVATFDEVVEALSGADVVLVGEVHGHERGLDFIATLFEALADRDPGLVLSMEFIERDHQHAMDDYIGGIIDRETMAAETLRSASNFPVGHQRMVERAKVDGRRVVAANAARPYVRMARTDGYEAMSALSDEQRVLFDVPGALPEGGYADRFKDAMGAMARHGGDEMVSSFLRSQALWDSTMAASVARQVQRGSRVYHVVGHFHVDFAPQAGGSAMVGYLRERLGDDVTIGSIVVHQHEGSGASLMGEDVGVADFVVYVDPIE
jgi:uncharacterized iron-regulated protein